MSKSELKGIIKSQLHDIQRYQLCDGLRRYALPIEYGNKDITWINDYITLDDEFMTEEQLNEYSFITLTFHQKYKLPATQKEQAAMLLQEVFFALRNALPKYQVYGSIEHHKTGVLHTHFIINTNIEDRNKLADALYVIKMKFTYDPNNKKCMVVKPVTDKQGCMEYINKENYIIYHYSK
jgi:hypothetical protein